MRIGRILRGDRAVPVEEGAGHPFQSFQAEELRRALSGQDVVKQKAFVRKTISVVSGKGGVGKSNVALNLALSMGNRLGLRTALLDADMGLANTDILLGLNVKYNLGHVIKGELELKDVLVPIAERVWLIPGGSGICELADMAVETRLRFISKLSVLDDMVDVILIDTGAGIQASVRDFALASDAVVLVTTPEPPAIKDAYGLLKSLVSSGEGEFGDGLHLLVNMALSDQEARSAADRICRVASEYLKVDINYLGCLHYDKRIPLAVKERCPFVVRYPASAPSRGIEEIATSLVKRAGKEIPGPTDKGFVNRFLSALVSVCQ
jgi:flagellar biosynthesis protein FlhG